MSPEQARGKPADFRSDAFSFGVVLYEMLSGRRPFTGDTVLDLLNNIVNDEPQPLETLPELNRILTRCLRKDPANRFQSMAEVMEALAQIRISTSKSEEQPSIAVLPFSNLSGDPENEYFCEGLTEEIINKLAQLPGLRVTARTSAFVFRKPDEDIRKIAEILGIQTILEGSVRKSGTRLRVTLQLINGADGYHLWSKSYDRESPEVFAVQDDISEAIAKALQLRLAGGAQSSQWNHGVFFDAGRAIEIRNRANSQHELVIVQIERLRQIRVQDPHSFPGEVDRFDLNDQHAGSMQHLPERLDDTGNCHVASGDFVNRVCAGQCSRALR